MKARYTKLSAGIVLGLCLGVPLQAVAAGGEYGEKKGASASETQSGKEMTKMTAADLGGKAVVNRNGEEIGEVDQIVRRSDDGRHFAVVSVGGFLGIGDRQVMVPLDELRIEGDKLHSIAASTESQLERQMPYQENLYQQVEGERTVQLGGGRATEGMGATGEGYAGGAAQTGGSRVGFGTMDVNRDGYLSKDEAAGAPRLVDRWQSADTNNDGRLDRAEFSAFEPMMDQPGQKEGMKGEKERMPGQQERMPGETGGRGY